ncbi:MarR family transcriptional regulator [Roseibium polysiphoniae]|uniref:MarR family transcriptional regulator n=1 Tax=Roseibium polysiphoniae TaxID=2571221 RepID=A0A944CDX0_9HYPH|nr:MarR family winged helix-turn-helix transcriptional regulator [Roseibium polysiphoniae]MBS8260148.1 MarR family transcriptional regulator [Roseibium polysiphoniae]
MTDDFTLCMLMNARRAARAVSRRYDRLARPYGLTAVQFSVMGAVINGAGKTTSELADGLGMERTTLVRNLALLEQQGLIRGERLEKGNGRCHVLTERGDALVDTCLPIWRKAQAELAQELGHAEFLETVRVLQRLAEVDQPEA